MGGRYRGCVVHVLLWSLTPWSVCNCWGEFGKLILLHVLMGGWVGWVVKGTDRASGGCHRIRKYCQIYIQLELMGKWKGGCVYKIVIKNYMHRLIGWS